MPDVLFGLVLVVVAQPTVPNPLRVLRTQHIKKEKHKDKENTYLGPKHVVWARSRRTCPAHRTKGLKHKLKS
jgi:hypothetical protein